nr:unnamed protein product [Haemonchus contortus]
METSSKRKRRTQVDKTKADTMDEKTTSDVKGDSGSKKRKKKADTICETQIEAASPRRKKTKKKDSTENTMGTVIVEVDDNEKLIEKGKSIITSFRARKSRSLTSLRKKKTKTEGTDVPTGGGSGESDKPPSEKSSRTSLMLALGPQVRERSSRKSVMLPPTQQPKEEKSVRTTSIRERLKRGLKSAISAFSKSSIEKSFQSAKARLGYTPPAGRVTYAYQDTYMGGAEDEEESEEEDEDAEALADTSHRDDLILVTTNNTNDGELFNEHGRPFWKDPKLRSEIPRNTRKPLSSLLLLLAERKVALKESVHPPANLEGHAQESDLDGLMGHDKKHFNEELIISNTIRSIIATLDDLDEYSKNKPQSIRKLDVLEPKTAITYVRRCPEKNEKIPFEYSGLGVCKSAKKKKMRGSTSTSTSSTSTGSTSDRESPSKKARRKKSVDVETSSKKARRKKSSDSSKRRKKSQDGKTEKTEIKTEIRSGKSRDTRTAIRTGKSQDTRTAIRTGKSQDTRTAIRTGKSRDTKTAIGSAEARYKKSKRSWLARKKKSDK